MKLLGPEHRGLEIEFMDGEKRTLPTANRSYVRDGVLHVHRSSYPTLLDDEHLGSYPVVNIKSYHWTS